MKKFIFLMSLICFVLQSVNAEKKITEEVDAIDKLIAFRDFLMKQDISFKHELLLSIDDILYKKIEGLREKRQKKLNLRSKNRLFSFGNIFGGF